MPKFWYPPISGSLDTVYYTGQVFPGDYSQPDTGSSNLVVSESHGDFKTPNAFRVERTRIQGATAQGKYKPNPYIWYEASAPFPASGFYNFCRSFVAQPEQYLSVPNGIGNRLFAASTPDRAQILAPVFIFELREIPKLIRDLGLLNIFNGKPPQSVSKHAASMWLSGNFGWAPLISDLKKLVTFADSFSKREREFDRLYSGSGLTRRLTLHEASAGEQVFTYSPPAQTEIGTVSIKGTPTLKVWGVVRYKPVPVPAGSQLRKPTPKEIRRIIFGLNKANIALNVWEALPWSWLIDYFFDVGSFLGANMIGRTCESYNGCVMYHFHVKWTSEAKKGAVDSEGNSFQVSAGSGIAETKNRTPVFPTALPVFLMSPLSGHQLSILAAVGTLRTRVPSHRR